MDRFLMRLQMGYPSMDSEMDILAGENAGYDDLEFSNPVSRDEIVNIRETVSKVYLEKSILEYILGIISATRTESA